MISTLRGQLIEKQPHRILVETGGIGYEITIPTSTFENMDDPPCEVMMHIYQHVREDTLALYGFQSKQEKHVFMLVLGVSGMGPKLALSVLSSLDVYSFQRAVIEGDTHVLSSISGVGKKTAERLILELRDKVVMEIPAQTPTVSSDKSRATRYDIQEDAIQALTSLGFSPAMAKAEVSKALRGEQGPFTVEDLLRTILKQ